MFDFINLDHIDADEETPDWVKWQGAPSVERVAPTKPAVLEDEREEHFAAPEEEYVFEKLEVPFLPEDGAFDPIGFYHDSTDAVEDKLAMYSGQCVMNFVAGTYEQHLQEEMVKQERQEFIEAIHTERVALLPSSAKEDMWKAKAADGRRFDHKPFSWREIHTVFMGQGVQLPDGGVLTEHAFGPFSKLMQPLLNVKGTAFVTPPLLIQLMCAVAHQARPAPSGPRIMRNAPWHLALTDVFFPSPCIVDNGAEYIGKKEEAPTFVHMVVISCNKETGEVEGKSLLENIKITGSTKYPKRSGGKS